MLPVINSNLSRGFTFVKKYCKIKTGIGVSKKIKVKPPARKRLKRRVTARRFARDEAWGEPAPLHGRRVPGGCKL
jgi:hypothetical protein